MSDTKPCPNCGSVQPLTDYYHDCTRPDGLSRLCKACDRERKGAYFRERYYPRHRDALKEAAMERQRELVAAGLCRECGRERGDDGAAVYCRECLERQYKTRRAQRARPEENK